MIIILCLIIVVLLCVIGLISNKETCEHEWVFERYINKYENEFSNYPYCIKKIYECPKCKQIKSIKIS